MKTAHIPETAGVSKMARDITTIPELKKAIRRAKVILVQPRFGVSEKWIKITKNEATYIVSDINDSATPEQHEMYGATFATMTDDDWLHLG